MAGPACGRALRELVRSFAPEVVHTHTSKAGVLGRSAARSARVPVIAHTFHGLVLRDYAAPVLAELARRIERRLARHTHLLFAVSESCRDELRELGVATDVRVVLPAVATASFAAADRDAARRRLGLAPDEVALGFVGRLAPVKEPLQFVALIDALPPRVRGFVLGDGPLREQVAAMAGPRVALLGAVADPSPLIAGLDLLVSTSRREGFPIAGVEAAAAGVPMLGHDVPGVRDLLRLTRPDLLVPREAGVDGLVARVRELLVHGIPRLGDEGRDLARRCAPDRIAARLLAAYP